ncbi:4-carboxymuconolactone decarboxylase [Lysobacter sp. CA199]|uniref:4-carboxymuconolactone decarboxylase n=1 Tax=Lysobacter sp. CA199 TaxID=3455608 RepID=UPI003F8D0829
MDEQERYRTGMKIRREVLGDAHVDRAMAADSDFTAEFQAFLTRAAWGTIWARDGLPRHTRSLLTIVMLVALGHDEELKLHVRAARNNGVTPDEIKEALMQAAIYCGVPAANHAFALARPIIEEQSAESATAQPTTDAD